METKLTRDELSLLLFFETRVVDYGGRVNAVHMNKEDFEIAKKWNKSGYVLFGRIKVKDHNRDGAHWAFLSESAWKDAHKERRDRAERMYNARRWQTTSCKEKLTPNP